MPEKDPTTWNAGMWFFATAMAFGGALVNRYMEMKKEHAKACSVFEFFIDVAASGFVGLAVFMALAGLDQPIGLCGAAAGVGGHMGTRLFFIASRLVMSRAKIMEKNNDS